MIIVVESLVTLNRLNKLLKQIIKFLAKLALSKAMFKLEEKEKMSFPTISNYVKNLVIICKKREKEL